MAVGIAREFLDPSFVIDSGGLDAAPNLGATGLAIKAMKELGIDIRKHRTQDISSLPLQKYDYVVAVTSYVAQRLCESSSLNKERLLTWNVPDPYGGDLGEYRRCAQVMFKYMDQLRCYIDQQGAQPNGGRTKRAPVETSSANSKLRASRNRKDRSR
jgi:protein-tyrosine-phosphatase